MKKDTPCLPHLQTEEFKGLVSEEYYDWVAQYLVVKRASIEPNFHSLYMSFMDTLASVPLRRGIIRETYRNIRVCWCDRLHLLPLTLVLTSGDPASRQDK